MKTKVIVPLVSMVDFILQIDWLTTTEFCTKYQIPLPKHAQDIDFNVSEFLRIDAIKHRMFVDYAKFLNNKITTDHLVKQFNFEPLDVRGGFPRFKLGKYEIVNNEYGFVLQPYDSVDGFNINKIGDLTSLGISYNKFEY